MALRARKSIRIAKGVNLNLSKSGVGIGVGPRGPALLGALVGTADRERRASRHRRWLPKVLDGRQRAPAGVGADARASAEARPVCSRLREGVLQGAADLRRGRPSRSDRAVSGVLGEGDNSDRAVSDDLLVGLLSVQAGDEAAATPFLEKVVGSDHELPDELMTKYVEEAAISVGVTDNVSVSVPFGSLAAALVLAQCYRRTVRGGDRAAPAASRRRSRSGHHARPLVDAPRRAELRRGHRARRRHQQHR